MQHRGSDSALNSVILRSNTAQRRVDDDSELTEAEPLVIWLKGRNKWRFTVVSSYACRIPNKVKSTMRRGGLLFIIVRMVLKAKATY